MNIRFYPFLLFLLAACHNNSPSSTKYEKLKQHDAILTSDKQRLSLDLARFASNYEALKKERDWLLEQQEKNIRSCASATLHHPTWTELKLFLAQDKTNEKTYVADQFDCKGFALELRDHARERGIRSAYATVGFGKDNTGHAFNAFMTTDKGLIYIDNGEQDSVAYIEVGKKYGLIEISHVREDIIVCPKNAEDFWKPIEVTKFEGNLFSYAYFENYQQRQDFLATSINAFKAEQNMHHEDIERYNSEIRRYNSQGTSSLSLRELKEWEMRINARKNKLNSWVDNINQLQTELGARHINNNQVESIEIYWYNQDI